MIFNNGHTSSAVLSWKKWHGPHIEVNDAPFRTDSIIERSNERFFITPRNRRSIYNWRMWRWYFISALRTIFFFTSVTGFIYDKQDSIICGDEWPKTRLLLIRWHVLFACIFICYKFSNDVCVFTQQLIFIFDACTSACFYARNVKPRIYLSTRVRGRRGI